MLHETLETMEMKIIHMMTSAPQKYHTTFLFVHLQLKSWSSYAMFLQQQI